jgi:Leucine-rich repeat (LRR) protein
MKKLFLITLALNFVACSNDSTENTTTPTAVVQTNSFNPNPTPEDYRNANYPNFTTTSSTAKVAATAVTYVNTLVPDAAFRNKLLGLGTDVAIDPTPGDNYISINSSRAGLLLDGSGISDLTGIQAFTSLAQLSLNGNSLTALNISALTNLSYLDCRYNNLTSLNLSANTNLGQIWCNNNPNLASLILPNSSTTLWGVWCYNCNLTSLNLNGNTKITDLFCQSNQLTTTSFNLGAYTLLKQINCSANKMATLDLHLNSNLTSFWCYSNTLLTDINIRNGFNTSITNQDFRYNTKAPKIHVDLSFYPNANTLWPNRGSSIYTNL